MKKINFHSIYLFGFFVILTLPLLNVPPLFSPPDWGKTILFRSILSVLIFACLFQFLFKKESEEKKTLSFLFKKSIVFQSLLAFFGIFLIATLFSEDFTFSLFGNPYRSGGFLNLSFLIAFPVFLYFVSKKEDWQKIWDFSILIGILVSVVALFQQFGIQKDIFIYQSSRPPSTIGITTALAIYLLLLSFPTLSFFLSTSFKKWFGLKKIFYLLSLILFISVSVFITQTRSAYIGLAIGFLFFLFFFPFKKPSSEKEKKKNLLKSFSFKAFSLIFLFLVILGVYFANNSSEFPQAIKENDILNKAVKRLSIERALEDPRMSGWPVALQALKSKPLLGYGPENFSIGFDKYFDPSLPNFQRGGGGTWWDRAHNIFLDTIIQAGIFALLIYLFLLISLIWQTQRIKNHYREKETGREKILLCHGFQASILGYFTANFFSFDVFSTYLLFFLITGHVLYLSKPLLKTSLENGKKKLILSESQKTALSVILLIMLVFFVAEYNLKPFHINTRINIASHHSENGNYQKALSLLEDTLEKNSFLNGYARLKYLSVVSGIIKEGSSIKNQLIPKAYKASKETTEILPYYTRNWMLAGTYTNYYSRIEEDQEKAKKLRQEADNFLKKANQLSPKRQEILAEWSRTKIYNGGYKESKEISQNCIEYNPEFGECQWQMALSSIYLQNTEEAQKYLDFAKEKRYNINSEKSLLELVNAYIETENYQKLVEVYKSLLKKNPDKVEYHTSLAVCYKELGELEKARQEALKVLEMNPGSKEAVEEFLKELEE